MINSLVPAPTQEQCSTQLGNHVSAAVLEKYLVLSPEQRKFCTTFLSCFNDPRRTALRLQIQATQVEEYLECLEVQEFLKEFEATRINNMLDVLDKDGVIVNIRWKLQKLVQVIDEVQKYICDVDQGAKYAAVIIRAVSELNKMQGDLAPVRTENVNLTVKDDRRRLVEMAQTVRKEY